MLKRKISLILTVAIGFSIINGPIQVLAKELKSEQVISKESNEKVATTKKFDLLDNENINAYNEIYKVHNSKIKRITNNGGKYGSSVIDRAVDEDFDTHWETGNHNSDTFKNEIIIELTEITELNRIVYGARQASVKGRGFAKRFKIYTSITDEGDDFTLVSSGEYLNSTKDIIEIKFKPTEFKRVKFVFEEADQNKASAAEFVLYKEDEISDKMSRLFTDESKSKVSEEFNTLEKIDALENEVKEHPLYNDFKIAIEDSKILVQNNKIEPSVAKTNEFGLYDNEEYSKLFRMDKSNVLSIKNNGGHYSSRKITYAVDEDVDTYWETKKGNSSSFNNEVEVEFKERTIIDRIVYGARQNDTKGFAEEFEIYVSNTTTGDTYNLVSTGSHSRVKGLIEVKFNPIEAKRVKFVFKKSNQNWATLNEIGFYKQDKLADEINSIFTNGLNMELKEGYDLDKILQLENEISNHPLREDLQKTLDYAKKILNKEIEVEGNYWDIERRGNSVEESKKRKIWNFQDWQPTGYRVKPGDVIDVYLDVEDEKKAPHLVFKQMDTKHTGTKSITLKPGKNTITIPEVELDTIRPGKYPGGVLYIVNPFTEEEQSREPKIRFENLEKYPHFIKGIDKDEEVLKELREYVELLNKDKTLPDVFEVFGDKSLINVTATEALNFYETSGKTPSYSADAQDKIIRQTMDFWGFDDSKDIHSDFNFRYVTMIKNLGSEALMNAANGVTGIRPQHQDGALNGNTSWGFTHEIGHNFDTRNRLIVEVTNNILPLQFQRLNNEPSRLTTSSVYEERVYPKVIKEDYENNQMHPNDKYNFQHIASLWQIALYDENFYPEFEKLFRENSETFSGENAVHNGWVKYSSDVLQKDTSEHFERHGAKLTEETKEYVSKYPKLDKKTWYANDSLYLEKGGAFTSDMDYLVSDVIRTNEGVKLTFKMDSENKKNRLGYEVHRDGKLIGFTENDSFVDKNPVEGVNHQYEIVAYDKTFTPSTGRVAKAFTPRIELAENVTLKLNEEFNPLEYAKALNYAGEDISKDIVIEGDVNTSVKGVYEVKYKVTNNDATVEKSMQVEVVSEYDYLSDYEWESVTTEYGTPRKNSNIKARVNGDIKEFEKGIGIHANGKVVYNLEGKEYDRFEALLGVDMTIPAQTKSSIAFKIFADGVEIANTKVLSYLDNAEYISVPVKGVSELVIEITDGNNGNASDHGVIANPKLTTNNAKPKLEIPKGEVTKLGLPIENLVGNIKATDAEDGDITNKVVVENNVNFNKAGTYNVVYKVTDSDGNEVSQKREIKVVDMDDNTYLSDIDWKSATTSHGKVRKDKSSSENTIRLTGENGEVVSYEKGIGTHATSTIIYDLTKEDYGYFTSYVGVDRHMYNRPGSVTFEVWLDNEKVYDSGLMKSTDKQKFVEVNLSGAKELKLVVTDGGNGIGSDHASFGDAKLYYANGNGVEVNRGELDKLLEEVKSLDKNEYTKESYDNLMVVNNKVIESLKDGYNQAEINKLAKELLDAKKGLVSLADYEGLEKEVERAKEYKEYLYTRESFSGLKGALDKAHKILEDRNSTCIEVDNMIKELKTKGEELVIVKGTGPLARGKDELENLILEADEITYDMVGITEHKDIYWNDYLENLMFAKEVLYDIDAPSEEVNSVYMFLETSIKNLKIKN
ncbi:MAG: NPCBM/NEW2 domain-containing protein [Clostridium sp.]